MRKRHFLAKRGKVFGPITESEFNALQSSGRIHDYSWMWDHEAHAWQAIDAAPPALTDEDFSKPAVAIETVAPIVPAPSLSSFSPVPEIVTPHSTGPSPAELGFHATKASTVPIICHNYKSVVSGLLQQMTPQGCEIHTDEHGFAPTFVARSAIILNLLDAKSGHLMNVTARVSGVTRTSGGWMYQVRWEGRPDQHAHAS